MLQKHFLKIDSFRFIIYQHNIQNSSMCFILFILLFVLFYSILFFLQTRIHETVINDRKGLLYCTELL